ncbi:MAG: hypothetical protein AAGA03_12350, partial [Planctomycetota bacterium]
MLIYSIMTRRRVTVCLANAFALLWVFSAPVGPNLHAQEAFFVADPSVVPSEISSSPVVGNGSNPIDVETTQAVDSPSEVHNTSGADASAGRRWLLPAESQGTEGSGAPGDECPPGRAPIDYLMVIAASALVFLMQAGFLCLESGLSRNKNSINVALKNVADFVVACLGFWGVGFGIMFGASWLGVAGASH